jgi:hypothetical protein
VTTSTANAIGTKAMSFVPGAAGALADAPLFVQLALLSPGLWVAVESAWTYSVGQRKERRRIRTSGSGT